jgi:DNA-binding transcriptional MerR regulator
VDENEWLTIGAFARRVGLTPSALRFYDDCGVLRPAHVDDVTGYRYYSPGQVARATDLRRLRAAGLPLVDVLVVLDGPPEQARAVLTGHARRVRESAELARATVEEFLLALPPAWYTVAAVLGAPELASAVRQVAAAVADGPTRAQHPELGCVLIEIDQDEVRFVATDRYRLVMRHLRPSQVRHALAEGQRQRILVQDHDMVAAASWATSQATVTLAVCPDGARLRGDDHERILPTVAGDYPDYRVLLDNLPPVRHRVITDRGALRASLGDGATTTLDADSGRLVVGTTTLPAIHRGPAVRIAFDPLVLGAALEASVGPDILLEISSPTEPVVARSADQGGFTTLLMPVIA